MEKPRFVSTLQPGDEVCRGKYRLVRKLGEGAFGEVFAAENNYTGGRVALKMLRREWSTDAQAVLRLRREAQAANRVVHRNVVRILDIDRHELTTVLVMELLQGETLSEALPSRRLPLHGWVSLLVQAMRGVAAVHKQGVVHRDIKPENIFLAQEDGSAELVTKVLDFGISKLESRDSHHHTLTRAGTQGLGSPRYMSPEQYSESKDVDHRSDVYSFGVVLYEALTGRYPFDAESVVALMWKVMNVEPVAPRSHCPEIPEALSQLVLRALSKRPEARFQSLEELIQALTPYTLERAFGTPRKAAPTESLVRRIAPGARSVRAVERLGTATTLAVAQLGRSHARLTAQAQHVVRRIRALAQRPRPRALVIAGLGVSVALGTSLSLGAGSALTQLRGYKDASCRWGHAAACAELADMQRAAGDFALATESLERACDLDDARSCQQLADGQGHALADDLHADAPAERATQAAASAMETAAAPQAAVSMAEAAAPAPAKTPSASSALPGRAHPSATRPSAPANANATSPTPPYPPLTAASDSDQLRASEALANLDRAAFEHPYDPDIQYALGVALREAGDRDAAVLAFTRATQLPVKTHSGALLHRTLAETLEAKGDLTRAIATMRLSLSAKRGARRCSGADERYLAQLLVKAGELDAAIGFLRPLYASAPSADEAARCKAFLSALVPGSPSVADRLSRAEDDVLSNPYRAPAHDDPKPHAVLPENPF